MVIPLFPRSNYRGFFTTGESYCTMYTLCNGKWSVLSLLTGCIFDRLPLSSLETQLKTLSSGQCVELTHCPLYFTFKNAISDKLTVQCLSWEVNNPSQIETDATKSQAWHQFWRKSPQHRKVWHRPHMTVLRFLFDKQDVKCAALLTQISHNDDRVRFFWHMALMHGDFRFYISDTFLERRTNISRWKWDVLSEKISLLTLFWHRHWANLLRDKKNRGVCAWLVDWLGTIHV